MIFLYLNENQIKLLIFKKNIFSHYEIDYFKKDYETELLKNGQIFNIDILASAIKEGLTFAKKSEGEKEIFLILPQNFFIFLRTEVPLNIAPSAIEGYVFEKLRDQFNIEDECLLSGMLSFQSEDKRIINFFGLNQKKFNDLQKVFSLLNLKLINILPETVAYFKLFDKTLKKNKNEIIFYVNYQNNFVFGYLYDNFGLLKIDKWIAEVNEKNKLDVLIKKEKDRLEKLNLKPNRLILAGLASENIRQDTFTKAIGIWTNPLKKIIANFYQDYLKILIVDEKNVLPILSLDSCFGAFVFYKEMKNLSFFKKSNSYQLKNKMIKPLLFPKKDLIVFFVSFVSSILFFIILSIIKPKMTFNSLLIKPSKNIPTSTIISPSLTPTPTIFINKETIRIKVLNGSGVSGKASAVKEILKEKGYQEILTGNADNFDYEKTELLVKKDKNYLISLIKEDLKNYVSSFKTQALAENEVSDIIIVIGKDFK